MPRYFTSSTLWYSGIFAVAATLDAGVKIERREQWDKAIAGVKQELSEVPTSTSKQLSDAPEEVEEGVEESATNFIPFDGLLEDENVFQYVDPSQPRPRWPAHTGDTLRKHRLAPLSIYANRGQHNKAETTPWTPKKLAAVQTSIEILQIRLFQRLQQRDMIEEATNAIPEDYAKHMLQDAEALRSQHNFKVGKLLKIKAAEPTLSDYEAPEDNISLCSYRQDHIGHFSRMVNDLNSSLQTLFKLRMDQQISQPALLAKISYNLSCSQAPPNLNTYNTLLMGLSRMHEPTLVRHIIASMCETHMRMNEVSLTAILHFYTKTDDRKSFIRLIEQMRAKHGGLALARPDIGQIREDGRSRLIRDPDNPSKIILLPQPTPMVFGAVIAGVLKFAGFDTALSICDGMGRDGWGLCMTGLTPLLRDCAERRDWVSGLAIWKQIQALKLKSRVKEGSRYLSERIRLDTFAAMIRLCTRCKQEAYFHRIWIQASNAHHNSTERLAQLVKGHMSVDLESATQPDATASSEVDYGYVLDNAADQALSNGVQGEKQLGASRLSNAKGEDPRSFQQLQAVDRKVAEQSIHESHALPLRPPEEGQLVDQLPTSHELDENKRGERLRSSRTPASVAPPMGIPSHGETLSRVIRSSARPFEPFEQLEEGQLLGTLTLGHELDDYELRERPMSTYARYAPAHV